MDYGVGALTELASQLKTIRPDGAILELGAQDINTDVRSRRCWPLIIRTNIARRHHQDQ